MLSSTISRLWIPYQRLLFPHREEKVDVLTDRHREIILALDFLRLERFLSDGARCGTGRRPFSRLVLARSFLAKAILDLPSTVALIDRLKVDVTLRRICGFLDRRDIPSEATFSNAFGEFARDGFVATIHETLVRQSLAGKIVGHISRDATAIVAREKSKPRPPENWKRLRTPKKRGRPRKGAIRENANAPKTRIDFQMNQSLEEMLAELPMNCACGSKRGSSGHLVQWFGYKLHMDVDDNSVPLSCVLTSASLNDSQVAIPLEKITKQRATSLYSLMDKGYDSANIRQFIRQQGKVPIIQPRRCRATEARPFDPATARRFMLRTSTERAFSELKDNLGCRHVRVRGAPKVFAHVMFGVLALTAFGMLQYWT